MPVSNIVLYRHVITPIGTLTLAATDVGIVRVAYDVTPLTEMVDQLTAEVGPVSALGDGVAVEGPGATHLRHAAEELAEYFKHRLREFTVPLDHRLSSGFRREVQAHIATIPYGETASYGEIAEEMGHPGAARAVGTACGTNPLPLLLPCHRVIRADGDIGEYGVAGPGIKQQLLDLEQHL